MNVKINITNIKNVVVTVAVTTAINGVSTNIRIELMSLLKTEQTFFYQYFF